VVVMQIKPLINFPLKLVVNISVATWPPCGMARPSHLACCQIYHTRFR